MRVSVVIPTKNRPIDLEKAVLSIVNQSHPPDELLVIDQSSNSLSEEKIKGFWIDRRPSFDLLYHLDPKVRGLVDARRVAVPLSRGDLVMYLEDDIELSPDYIKSMVAGFDEMPEMIACTGIMTNYQASPFYQKIFRLFHRGIFRDSRIAYHGPVSTPGRPSGLVPIEFISGGISAYRREALEKVPFDTENEFFAYEDAEYSSRISKAFGKNRLFLNPLAHLVHHYSPTNRASAGPRIERKAQEVVVFFKKHREIRFAWFDVLVLEAGMAVESLVYSVKMLSLTPFIRFIAGLRKGIAWKLR